MGNDTMISRAKGFIYRNARLLDRKRFEYFFEGGTAEVVLKALRAYQNEDGGFGNALEPDIRCPSSQPEPTHMALSIMDDLGDPDPELLDGILRYLRKITLPGGGIPFVFKDASDYPHAPWWSAGQDEQPSINPTGAIIGLLQKQKTRTDFLQEEWFKQNEAYIERVLEQGEPSGYHDAVQWITYLQYCPDREKTGSLRSKLDDWLRCTHSIERDPTAGGYVHKVLDWAPNHGSYANKFITQEERDQHLQCLLDQQQEDGGWPVNWPQISLGAEMEWRGWITVERLKTLRSYGRI
jgi:hypothetical protein